MLRPESIHIPSELEAVMYLIILCLKIISKAIIQILEYISSKNLHLDSLHLPKQNKPWAALMAVAPPSTKLWGLPSELSSGDAESL